ncbi:hypothetical protein N7470_007111 [Penicillium chermesinum]|nr:hypothetical protein N7470_007111 [Penicillium chermesinum]
MGSSITGPSLEGGLWAGIVIAAVIVVLRIYAKCLIKRFRADDVLMLLSLLLAIASMVLLTLSVKHGFGGNLALVRAHDRMLVLKYVSIQIATVTFSTTSARTSFILYILGLLGTKKTYLFLLWAVLLIQLGGNIASAILPLSICRDASILWDPTVKTTCGDASVIVPFAYFSNSFNSAADLFLAVFSAWVFWSLNLKTSMKLTLIALLSLGLIAMVASVIKTTKLKDVPSPTNLGTDGSLQLIAWGYVELIIIMSTSSIPCLRPLIVSSIRKISSGGMSRSYELSGGRSNKFSSHSNQNGGLFSSHSNRNHGFRKTPDPENDSIERILNTSNNISANGEHELSEVPYNRDR